MKNKNEIILKIASKKGPEYVKGIAGAIGWQLRENGYCKARAIKANAVNTVIKAVSIINGRTSKAGLLFSIDLMFSPVNIEEEKKETNKSNRSSTAIEICIHECETENKPFDIIEYKVSGKQINDNEKSSIKLASAISVSSIKQKIVRLRCIGPLAVYRAILACCIAKGTVYSNGFESCIVPTWSTIKSTNDSNSKSISLLQIDFWTIPI